MHSLVEALKNIFRNKFLSFISIVSICLIFTFINLISSVNFFTLSFIEEASNKIENQIYLDDLSTQNITQIQDLIHQSQIIDYKILEPEQGLNQLKDKYPNLENFLLEYNISNPLPYTLNLKTSSLEEFTKIKEQIQDLFPTEFNQQLNNQSTTTLTPIVENLSNFKSLSFKILIVTTLSLLIISALILSISIQNNFYSRKNEIQIMELLGAKISKIQNPIILEGIIIVVVGVLLAILINEQLIQNMQIYLANNLKYNFYLIQIAAAILISSIISYFICKKHLKKQRLIHDI